ncbi:polyadenylate-binding protein RBP45 [Selaginella moellendorffii]|uniref:polyadenylate-binding protein RBP45 n=1 Tax=Selaginella moellendorffii TaxID=88036 RepID=UPI000D1C528A|nr:polyadenylate-binding protein RBP45 [Selaginella moellendorffii]|eukprot:XP_024544425.1 polyadenylate-binding protein RBP45 [Selaginella moellendorffii]
MQAPAPHAPPEAQSPQQQQHQGPPPPPPAQPPTQQAWMPPQLGISQAGILPPQQEMLPPVSVMLPPLKQGQAHSPGHANGELKTLWVGDLQYWMDEGYLYSCFAHTSEVQVAKVIRNKQTGYSEGYGFVEFTNHSTAEKVLQSFNGTQMPSTDIAFRLNWACFGIGERRPDQGPDFSIFVGDLAPDVTDYMLQETFQSRYSSVKGAKVVMDTTTARSKGYGFVRFGDEAEKMRAMTEMAGVYCSTRPMRISTATPKKSLATIPPKVFYPSQNFGVPPLTDNDPSNTTVFVGGLDHSVKDEDLKQVFSQFGDIQYVKIPAGKNCGFVQFYTRASAEEALQKLHGSTIGQQTIRLSWGRSPANKQRPLQPWGQQVQPEFNQWNGPYYGYGQGYECYGFAPPPQDPGAYAYGNFPQAYGTYPQQVS